MANITKAKVNLKFLSVVKLVLLFKGAMFTNEKILTAHGLISNHPGYRVILGYFYDYMYTFYLGTQDVLV